MFRFNPTDGRSFAIDYGEKRVGVAVTCPLRMFASGLPTIERNNHECLFDQLLETCKPFELKEILVGLPLHMNDMESEISREVRTFVEELTPYFEGPIKLVDERLSSFEAEERLKAQGIKPSKNKAMIDQMAAKILLEENALPSY
jgi:putative Holliday junction resolvase